MILSSPLFENQTDVTMERIDEKMGLIQYGLLLDLPRWTEE